MYRLMQVYATYRCTKHLLVLDKCEIYFTCTTSVINDNLHFIKLIKLIYSDMNYNVAKFTDLFFVIALLPRTLKNVAI